MPKGIYPRKKKAAKRNVAAKRKTSKLEDNSPWASGYSDKMGLGKSPQAITNADIQHVVDRIANAGHIELGKSTVGSPRETKIGGTGIVNDAITVKSPAQVGAELDMKEKISVVAPALMLLFTHQQCAEFVAAKMIDCPPLLVSRKGGS